MLVQLRPRASAVSNTRYSATRLSSLIPSLRRIILRPKLDDTITTTSNCAGFLPPRSFHSSAIAAEFHFDTHHFVQRLEREGLNRAQAEGMMTAMAEVIDESIRNMTGNMVTKADQEKVCSCCRSRANLNPILSIVLASIYPEGRLCPA